MRINAPNSGLTLLIGDEAECARAAAGVAGSARTARAQVACSELSRWESAQTDERWKRCKLAWAVRRPTQPHSGARDIMSSRGAVSVASGDVVFSVDIPSALAPDVHGEGTYTLYQCQIMARCAARTVSWCAPSICVRCCPVPASRALAFAQPEPAPSLWCRAMSPGKCTSVFRTSATYARHFSTR